MANSLMPGESMGMPSRMGGLLDDPLLQIGLGILANNTGNYGQLGPALGRGVQQGISSLRQGQQMKQLQTLRDFQMQQAQREAEAAARKQASDDALSSAISNSVKPADSVPNMSFMDANNQVMAGNNPDYQWKQQPGGLDMTTIQNNVLNDPNINGMDKLMFLKQFNKTQEPLKIGKDDRLITLGPDGTPKTLVDALPDTSSEKLPDKVRQYQFAQQNGFRGSFTDFLKIVPEAMMPIQLGQLGVSQQNAANNAAETAYTTRPSTPTAKSNPPLTVTVNGKTYAFKDKKSLNNFKIKAGIQ